MKPADLLLQSIQASPAFTALSGSSRRMNSLQHLGMGGIPGEDGRTIRRRLERKALKAAKKNWGKQ